MTLKKAVVSLHLIRTSDVWSQAMTDLAPMIGGLVEFYRSPAVKQWTPTYAFLTVQVEGLVERDLLSREQLAGLIGEKKQVDG